MEAILSAYPEVEQAIASFEQDRSNNNAVQMNKAFHVPYLSAFNDDIPDEMLMNLFARAKLALTQVKHPSDAIDYVSVMIHKREAVLLARRAENGRAMKEILGDVDENRGNEE